MDSNNQHSVLIGPFPPPNHGSSILAKQLSEGLKTARIESGIIGKEKNLFLAIISLLIKVIKVKEKKVIIFTASKTVGKARDLLIIFILLLKRKKIYVCIHNNPFFTKGILSNILFFLSRNFISIFSYKSEEYSLLKSKKRDVRIIYTAVPDEKLILQQQKEFQDSIVRFAICSHIIKFKNIDKAIKLLIKSKIKWSLDIIGSYSSNYGSQIFEQYKLEENITFHGELYGKEKIKILNQSNILLHLSLNEEFPLVQIASEGVSQIIPNFNLFLFCIE